MSARKKKQDGIFEICTSFGTNIYTLSVAKRHRDHYNISIKIVTRRNDYG
jgi:hypothetical protein